MMAAVFAAVWGAGACWLAAVPSAHAAETNSVSGKILYYTCPMHPSVRAEKPGDCPVCGMHLVPVYAPADGTNAAPAVTGGGCCGGGQN